ncbi:type VII secretion protein EccB [Saccharopolyspora sp. K220]|uniref:type VII secretion protein EccB n=1 Tax=Saccharopolyspora soli TaxID=2926618 RepID=UPI001F55BEC9|nr:type VII secretion protein EccB [Saccharopolyspora soli]MCI2417476.1 type VII secretion protein EccB [Saccharopolyspora soli]
MQSRRDQVQAYFFMVGRLVSALMRGRPDEQATPTRRFVVGAVIGTLLGGLVVAGFGVYGMVVPGGNNSWRAPGTVIVAKETGTRFLYLDGVLHPVLNYSSAMLASNSPQSTVKSVSQNSLQGVPRGAPIGIADAPDSLPSAKNLISDPWVACVATVASPSGAEVPIIDLQVGAPPGAPLTDDEGLLVSTPDSGTFLVWQGKRLRMPNATAVNALGYGDIIPFPVPTGWINALATGPDLVSAKVPGAGSAGMRVAGQPSRVGQIYEVRNPVLGKTDFYLLLADGFAPLTPTMASLLLADPAISAAYPGKPPAPIAVGPEVLAAIPRSASLGTPAGYPPVPPRVRSVGIGGSLRPCAAFAVTGRTAGETTIRLVSRAEATGTGQMSPGASQRITVPPNRGVLVRDQPAPGVPTGTHFLVSDLGVKYPLPSLDVAATLGYGGVPPVPVPTPLLSLLPTGPALDPAAAVRMHPASPQPAAIN